jgi:hypothetical protein
MQVFMAQNLVILFYLVFKWEEEKKVYTYS